MKKLLSKVHKQRQKKCSILIKYAFNSLNTLQPQGSRLIFGTWNRLGRLGRNILDRPLM